MSDVALYGRIVLKDGLSYEVASALLAQAIEHPLSKTYEFHISGSDKKGWCFGADHIKLRESFLKNPEANTISIEEEIED